MELDNEDWHLITSCWRERDRLKAEKKKLEEALAAIRRDLKQLTNCAIARKFDIPRHVLDKHQGHYRE